jgi:hypothetical protein
MANLVNSLPVAIETSPVEFNAHPAAGQETANKTVQHALWDRISSSFNGSR